MSIVPPPPACNSQWSLSVFILSFILYFILLPNAVILDSTDYLGNLGRAFLESESFSGDEIMIQPSLFARDSFF